MSPRECRFSGSDVTLCYFDWGDSSASRTVLLFHATGFHARCWDQVIAALPPDVRAIAVDLRGHGRSEKRAPYTWSSIAGDLVELTRSLELHGAVGVGHSMGGHCLVQVAHALPASFSHLILVDPVIMPPEVYGLRGRHAFDNVEDHPVARRRGIWTGWREMFDRFVERHPYSLWRREVLEDYCRHGLLPLSDGTFSLACPPEVEASIYMANATTNVYDLIPEVEVPVTVMRARTRDFSAPATAEARMDFSTSPTWPGLAAAFPHGEDLYLPELTHFMPMQEPQMLAARIVAAFESTKVAGSGR